MLIIRPYQESDAQSIGMSVCPFTQHDNPAVLCGTLWAPRFAGAGILFLFTDRGRLW
jgi:hypothetical protein